MTFNNNKRVFIILDDYLKKKKEKIFLDSERF